MKPRSMGKALQVDSREMFDGLLDHLMTETRRAGDHLYLWSALDAAVADFGEEMNQTPQFWGTILRALQDSVVLRLARLFDPKDQALSLGNLLATISYRGRYPSSSLNLNVPGLDIPAVGQESESVSRTNPLVSRLLEIRYQYLAHRDARLVSSGSFSTLPKVDRNGIETLLALASQIAEKYCRLYERPVPYVRFAGADDHKHLLDLLRVGLNSLDPTRVPTGDRTPSKSPTSDEIADSATRGHASRAFHK